MMGHNDLSMKLPVFVPIGVMLTVEVQHWLPELVQVAVSVAQQGNCAGPCPSRLLPLPSRWRLRFPQMGTREVSLVMGSAPCRLPSVARFLLVTKLLLP